MLETDLNIDFSYKHRWKENYLPDLQNPSFTADLILSKGMQ